LITSARVFLTGRSFGQKIKLGLSKLEVVTQCHRQRNNAVEQTRLLLGPPKSAYERN